MSVGARPDFAGLPADFREAVGWDAAADARLGQLGERLAAANRRMNLVGASTLETFWTRHAVDSAQLLWFEPAARRWADLGSGAGFPGLVLGALLKGKAGAEVHLVESQAKKCGFLREAVDELGLPCMVHQARAESLRLEVEVVTARACAPLERLLGFARPYLARGARGLFLKGEAVEAEMVAAEARWRFEAEIRHSLSDPRGRVVAIRRLAGGRIL
jgi:16S rRNA (guanine527-N7)-methyltransferase